jgi:hypothetical protein
MPLTLARETWGQRVHRAYRSGRDQYNYTYEDVARQISRIGMSISQQTIFRLEKNDTPPRTARGQLNAWLILTAYGYDPADFQIKEPMGKLLDWGAVKAELNPAKWSRQVGSSPVRSRWSASSGAGTLASSTIVSA